MPDLDLNAMRAAASRIAPHVRRTPLLRSTWLSEVTGRDVFLKLESLQVTGSFKARGAVNAAFQAASASQPVPPVLVTASAGNAGRALAYAARLANVRAVVFTPRSAPRTKLEAIRRLGADLRAEANSYEESEELAKAYATRHGLRYLSPYSHPDIIAGAATVALEVLEELPGAGTVLAPVGGGGLLSGVALAARQVREVTEVIGAEAEASPAFTSALAAGRIVTVDVGPTLADGLAGNMDPETVTFDIVRRTVDRVTLVPEDAIERAVYGLVRHEHVVAEGAGATAVAALLATPTLGRGTWVTAIVSGGNIDPERLAQILAGREVDASSEGG